MTVGERIIQLRKSQNLNQAQLAKLLDVSRQAVSKWENGLAIPDMSRMIQLAELLNTDVEYLATGQHTTLKAEPQIITVEKPVEVEIVREKIREVPVVIQKTVEVPVIQTKTRIKKVKELKYVRNPYEFLAVGLFCFVFGLILGLII